MIQKITDEIKTLIGSFLEEDQIIFDDQKIQVDKTNFKVIDTTDQKKIAFVDGGQAEIISAGNFCLSFIRIFCQIFQDKKRISSHKKEFYLFTKASYNEERLYYESRVFGDMLVSEQKLLIDSSHETIRDGLERAPIFRIANMARRFAELGLAKQIEADYVVLDGTLHPTFKGEEEIINSLPNHICALAKSSNLFTVLGNSPSILLNKISPFETWSYLVKDRTYFVKLHPKSKHVFRFEGEVNCLPSLIINSNDSLFLGYPYGLIFVDQFARITNQEKSSLKSSFLLRKEAKEIVKYLSSTNAHDILDSISY